jgi:hypothetical protein
MDREYFFTGGAQGSDRSRCDLDSFCFQQLRVWSIGSRLEAVSEQTL